MLEATSAPGVTPMSLFGRFVNWIRRCLRAPSLNFEDLHLCTHLCIYIYMYIHLYGFMYIIYTG